MMLKLGNNELDKARIPPKLIKISPFSAIFEAKNVREVVNLIDINKTY